MATDFQRTPLWRKTLGIESGNEDQDSINLLRSAFLRFRHRTQVLAEEIRSSMPLFTDHGIEHIDSLWDTASLLLPDDYDINPAEAFVLGGSFLMHDLGMGLAAYPDKDKLFEDPIYKKALASEELDSNASTEVQQAASDRALVTTLRLKHANQAARLIDQPFSVENDAARTIADEGNLTNILLLADDELRQIFGEDIGRIAQSHWYAVDELPSFLSGPHGTDGSLPGKWKIDPLKLALILRLADATHIDSRRAPLLLHAFRPPVGISKDHWTFQLKLNRPILQNGRLLFTSNRPFTEGQAQAWWLAQETLQMIDGELRQVESLCLDLNRPTFAANSVAGISSPDRLAKFVETHGWTPVDATIKATNVDGIVENLGGEKLYGKSRLVALRELISNAADASKLVSAYTRKRADPIQVRLYHEGGRDWIEIKDQGIGMLREQMAKSLLDFGSSQWKASLNDPDLEPLTSDEFRPRGRFGIGFFSIFMIADRVEIRSLRYLHGASDTAMLIFEDGLKVRPLFHEVRARERLTVHGTTIRARLVNDPLSTEGLLETDTLDTTTTQMLRDRLRELCALLDVDVEFEGPDDLETTELVHGDDWIDLESGALFDRLYATELKDNVGREFYVAWRDHFVQNQRPLFGNDGEVVGRAVLASGMEAETVPDVWWWPSPAAKIYVGGMYSDYIQDCIGAFIGNPLKADRNAAFPVASPGELKKWAAAQMDILTSNREASMETRYGAAELGRSVGVDLPEMPCGYVAEGEIAPSQLHDWISSKSSILLIANYELNLFQDENGRPLFRERKRGRKIVLPSNAIVINLYQRQFFPEEIAPASGDIRFDKVGPPVANQWNPSGWWHYHGSAGSTGILLDAALKSWDVSPSEIASNFDRLLLGEEDLRLRLPVADTTEFSFVEAFEMRRPD